MKNTYELAVELYEKGLQNGYPKDVCQCCGAHVNEGVKGCFELFAELVASGYGGAPNSPVNLMRVDAHALQHPEIHGKKNNAFHLIRLGLFLQEGDPANVAQDLRWLQKQFDGRSYMPALEPPTKRGRVTIVDVAGAPGPVKYEDRVRLWAESVWEAWSVHHQWVREWLRNDRRRTTTDRHGKAARGG